VIWGLVRGCGDVLLCGDVLVVCLLDGLASARRLTAADVTAVRVCVCLEREVPSVRTDVCSLLSRRSQPLLFPDGGCSAEVVCGRSVGVELAQRRVCVYIVWR
jgi:hypothetical protein